MRVIRTLWQNAYLCATSKTESDGYPPTFAGELNHQCGRILFFGSLLTMVAWLPYLPLDAHLHPDVPLIPVIRIGLSVISLIIFVLYLSRRFPDCNLLFLNILGAYLVISCGLITALTGADPVYLGGYLFILTLLAVVPVRRWAALIILAASLGVFFVAGFVKGMTFSTWSARYSLLDLLSAAFVAVLFIYLLNGKRHASWLKSKKIEEQRIELKEDREKIDRLLLNILPAPVAAELKDRGAVKPVYYPDATIVFTDFVGFTDIAEKLSPDELVWELDAFFSRFDRVMDRYGLEKLKTIGDAYMYAGGLPVANNTHALDAVLGALEILAWVEEVNARKAADGLPVFEIRIGIHSGPLMAGIVGEKKFVYDVWGDSVNLASRMESSGQKGQINISQSTRARISNFFETENRGRILAKNKGAIEMFFVKRIYPDLAADDAGRIPNDAFWNRYRSIRDWQPGELG